MVYTARVCEVDCGTWMFFQVSDICYFDPSNESSRAKDVVPGNVLQAK